ncbi:hypothetical protein HUA74_19125 [Myxococcus sp. CA051A]|uniref:hypothetical protein n=1 Tax=unclassified Myxococcus TaxID=2648731 RepID=UPI00157A556A|nr:MULTISPECIES: hypothetical protein [unclassified Myxococcus]NTX01858.1 hypothetical protein [Myxococcus sp. CA040A]NTX16493.1 hypothetical protein [Myxococcus sp. CA056]NTX38671.1 hypothetical protein [Myxococcus sp. CA033]NTX52788.1 hypothetical protein [Myxococcus sp. CA039A]NTX62761.1 hypothetical protein [Myxococcus sp. CA051A]
MSVASSALLSRSGVSRGWLFGAAVAMALVVATPGRADAQCTSWPTNTTVTPGAAYSDTINVSGLAYGTYIITASFSGSAGLINMAFSAVPGVSWSNGTKGFIGSSTTMYMSFIMAPGALPGRWSTVTMNVANTAGQTVCSSSFVVFVAGDACPGDVVWNGTTVDATFDGANCYVASMPAGDGSPFMHANNYYMTRGPNNVCEAGWFDGANCYLGTPPSGKSGFFWGSAFYYSP